MSSGVVRTTLVKPVEWINHHDRHNQSIIKFYNYGKRVLRYSSIKIVDNKLQVGFLPSFPRRVLRQRNAFMNLICISKVYCVMFGGQGVSLTPGCS